MLYYTHQILWFIHHSFTYVAAYLCFLCIFFAGSLKKGESLSMSNPLLLLSRKFKDMRQAGLLTQRPERGGVLLYDSLGLSLFACWVWCRCAQPDKDTVWLQGSCRLFFFFISHICSLNTAEWPGKLSLFLEIYLWFLYHCDDQFKAN